MIETRTQVLEELHDKTLAVIIDSEVQIEYLKKQDPKMVVLQRPMKKFNPLTKKEFVEMANFTAEMLVTIEKTKLTENNEVLNIIKKKIEEEKGHKPQTLATPSGPTS